MLPSGNDAAMTISNYLGKIIGDLIHVPKFKNGFDLGAYENISRFVKEMNKLAFKLGLRSSQFSNPHGLASKSNKSTVDDLGRLAHFLL